MKVWIGIVFLLTLVDMKGLFLDISKAFDKVWHKGLLFKLSLYGISGNLLKLLRDFLYYHKQRVVWNGQNSSWENNNAGVPQGSVLGRLLFLIYSKGLSNGVFSNSKLFADETSLFSVVNDTWSSPATLCNDPPRWNSHCLGDGAYPPKSSNQSASARRAQLSVAAKAIWSTDLLNHNVKTWVNTN